MIEPDRPVVINNYLCGKSFDTYYLKQLSEHKDKIGIVDISIKKAELSYKQGDFEIPIKTLTSGIGHNHNQGGQSQNRFMRKREEAIDQFFNRVIDEMNNYNVKKWKVIGKAGHTVSRFSKKLQS